MQQPTLKGSPDAEYIARVLGTALKQALSEVVEKRPWDPIEYLAQWLYKHKQNLDYDAKKNQESVTLADESRGAEAAAETRKKRRDEAIRIREKEEREIRQKEEEERKQREQEELQKKAKESLHLAQPPVLATVAEEAGETPEAAANRGIVEPHPSVLHEAVAAGGEVLALLEQGADLAQRDENGRTARDLAEELGQEKVLADIDSYVAELFRNKDTEKITTLIQQNYTNFPDVSQIYPEITPEETAFYEWFEEQLKTASTRE